jgi:vancomycin resistance protein YoaR
LSQLPALLQSRRAVVIGAVVAGLALVYFVLLLVLGSGVARGTTVLGTDIGGLSRPAAVAKLDAALAARAKAPITATAGGTAVTVDPVAAGLGFDAARTVDAADGRTFNPVSLLGRIFGGSTVQPVVSADPTKLASAVAVVARTVDKPGKQPAITFPGGTPAATQGTAGTGLQRPAAADALKAAFLVASGPVTLPYGAIDPSVSAAAVQNALTTFATPAVSGPITLRLAGRTVAVPVATFSKFLTMRPDGAALVPSFDGAGLKAALAPTLAGVEQPPIDAKFSLTGTHPTIVASQVGHVIEPKRLSAAVVAILPRTTGRLAVVPLVDIQPTLTTAKANTLGVREVIGTFTTHYPYAAYRLQNIHRAADLINGKVLLPGDIFSLNRTVGERTAANGFAIGFIINNGKFEKDFGGGTSQVATTTFNAAFFAGLKIVEHKAHSLYISRYPAGREATVAWPDLDLKFQNDSGHAVVVITSYTSSTVTVTIWGTKVYDSVESVSGPRYNDRPFPTQYDATPTCLPEGGVDGFDIDVQRVFTKGGKVVRTEPFHTHYAPTPLIYCRAAPGPTPPPSPTPTPSKPAATPSPSPTKKP